MKLKIDKIQNIIFAILLSISVIFLVFGNILVSSDELWNFQNLCKMSNGLIIYKDANVIITPIFFYIAHVILSVFGTNILVFRIYSFLIYICIFILIYEVFKNLKVSKHVIVAYLVLILEFIFQIISAGANYNLLAVLFLLIGLNLYITKRSSNLKQGILIFLIFFTKQNIGVLYAIIVMAYEFYKNKLSKKFIVDQFKKFFFFLIPTILLILQMYFKGNLLDFINYTFGGLLDFGKSNLLFATTGYYPLIFVFSIILYVFIIVKRDLFTEVISNEVFDNLTLLFIFSIGITFVIFPIMNQAHFLIAIPIYLIFLFYLFDVLLFESLFGTEKYIKNVKWFSIAIVFVIFIRIIVNMLLEPEATFIIDKKSYFYGTYIHNSVLKKTDEIESYILKQNEKGIDVIILSYDAAFPMINLKQNHGAYDLLFNGNMGYKGIDKFKKDIIGRVNTEFLIVTDEKDIFWQESIEIRDFIMKNLTCSGKICNYTIYSTNDN